MIIFLLTLIAIGILLLSEPGRTILYLIFLGIVCLIVLVLIVGILLLIVSFLFAVDWDKILFLVDKITSFETKYDWIAEYLFGILIGFGLLVGAIYKALFPFGYDKKRQIWTGKLKGEKFENEKE
jgi:hypothetical protein